MSPRLGPGPVFVYEWLTTARRWQTYAIRAAAVAMILAGMALVWIALLPKDARAGSATLREVALFGEMLYRTIAIIEVSLVLLAAPSATAGAICLDKARGTLDHMLVTDLSNAEIVLGKLGVRLIPVLGLIGCTLPVLALSILLGGVDPMALIGLFLTAIGCAFVGCTLAMALSLYGRKTHEVLMLTYLVIVLWLISPILLWAVGWLLVWVPPAIGGIPVYQSIEWSNPYLLAFAPYDQPTRFGLGMDLGFLAGCLAVSAALTVLAIARIRRVVARQSGRPAGGRRGWRRPRWLSLRWLPGPSLDRNPVAWREWHRMRPSWMLRVAWGLYIALGFFWMLMAALDALAGSTGRYFVVAVVFQVSIGLLLLSVSSATSLAEERARGSLDILLSTPISTRSILAGKWWGSFRRVVAVAFWPAAITGLCLGDPAGWPAYLTLVALVTAYGGAITSLGLAIATWVARPGRAVAVCLTVYILGAILWPIAIIIVLSSLGGSDYLGFVLFLGDPPMGVGFLSYAVYEPGGRIASGGTIGDLAVGAAAWVGIYAGVAMSLNWAAYATFDACLGRIPDDGLPRPMPPRRRSDLSPEELLALVPSTEDS